MIAHLVITVIADDRPGVVEKLANIIAEHHGNWLQSQLAHVHGKFAGIVGVAINEMHLVELQAALSDLQQQGFTISYQIAEQPANALTAHPFELNIVGPDRPGIIREVSRALAKRGINLLELTSECSSMPWTGEPMFTAQGKAVIPTDINLSELDEALDMIADELGLDIALEDRQQAAL